MNSIKLEKCAPFFNDCKFSYVSYGRIKTYYETEAIFLYLKYYLKSKKENF